jgi:hypothetical protein
MLFVQFELNLECEFPINSTLFMLPQFSLKHLFTHSATSQSWLQTYLYFLHRVVTKVYLLSVGLSCWVHYFTQGLQVSNMENYKLHGVQSDGYKLLSKEWKLHHLCSHNFHMYMMCFFFFLICKIILWKVIFAYFMKHHFQTWFLG